MSNCAPASTASLAVAGTASTARRTLSTGSAGSPQTSPTASHDSAHRGLNQPSRAAVRSARTGTPANLPLAGQRSAGPRSLTWSPILGDPHAVVRRRPRPDHVRAVDLLH